MEPELLQKTCHSAYVWCCDSPVVRLESIPDLPFQARQVQRVLAEAEQAHVPEVRS